MLLGVVLLYVGAVLGVNGIWLIGQARAAQAAPAPVAAGTREDHTEVSASVGGRGVEPPPARAERSPLLIQNREVAVLNIFTGFVGVVVAVILLVQGGVRGDLASVRGGGFILLFAFTYLWVAFNQFLDAGGNPAVVWLGINWFAWAVLWAVFWALLALDRPIARLAGWLAIIEGILTAWALGFAVLIGALAF